MSRTPVHNRLQAMFLDDRYRLAFVKAAAPEWVQTSFDDGAKHLTAAASRLVEIKSQCIDWIARLRTEDPTMKHGLGERNQQQLRALESAMLTHEAVALSLLSDKPSISTQVAFEKDGADVLIEANVYVRDAVAKDPFDRRLSPGKVTVVRNEIVAFRGFAIEIKPTVADEYPAVLRQMNRNRSRYLFVERYQGDGATEEQFVAMFAASGKGVVFKRDVDAAL